MGLEPILEGGEPVNVSDGGGELIPPLGGQTGEDVVLGPGALQRWDHQTTVRRRLIWSSMVTPRFLAEEEGVTVADPRLIERSWEMEGLARMITGI